MHRVKRAVRFTSEETNRLVDLVERHIPKKKGIRILDVRCFDGSTSLELASRFPRATIHAIDTHNDVIMETRSRVEARPNALVFSRDLRQMRRALTDENGMPMSDRLYHVITFFRSAGSYRTNLKYAITSLARAVYGAADILAPRGRIILLRSHACKAKMNGMLDDKHYRALFAEPLGFKILMLNRNLVVVERR